MSSTETICFHTSNTFFFSFIRQLMTLRHPERCLILLSGRIRQPDILWLCLRKFNIHRIAFSPTAVYELILAKITDSVTSGDVLLMTGSQTITLLKTTYSEQKLFQQRVRGSPALSIYLCVCVCEVENLISTERWHKQHEKEEHRKIMSELLTCTKQWRQEGQWRDKGFKKRRGWEATEEERRT